MHLGLLHELSYLFLIDLPKLRHIWNRSPQGILHFKSLKVLAVQNCSDLKHAFTWSLDQLEEIEIKNSDIMEAIIIDEEEKADIEVAKGEFSVIFPSLKYLVLEGLAKLYSFYSGSRILECQSLKKVSIHNCPNIKPNSHDGRMMKRLGKEEINIQIAPQKVLPSSEDLSIDSKSDIAMLKSELTRDFFSKIKVIKLHTKELFQDFLFDFLTRVADVEELRFCDSSLKELFQGTEDDATALPNIRTLRVDNLDNLTHIWKQNSTLEAKLFQHLKTLDVMCCSNLRSLAPSSASFQHLMTLEVSKCSRLKNLVTSSVAKSMVLLETFSINSCSMLKVIVSDEHDGTSDKIVFKKLKTVKLIDLHRLTSFCSLVSCSFDFSSLEHMIVENCPILSTFILGVLNTPMLHRVRVTSYGRNSHWDGNLNSTIQKLHKEMAESEEKNAGYEDKVEEIRRTLLSLKNDESTHADKISTVNSEISASEMRLAQMKEELANEEKALEKKKTAIWEAEMKLV